tara:strand:- start:358 stop:588 length:231 start_codon:yes stop_codon:yes gene_type:complete
MNYLHIISALLVPVLAFGAGRSIIFWSILGFYFGVIALVVIFILPIKAPKPIPPFIYHAVIKRDFRKWAKSFDSSK